MPYCVVLKSERFLAIRVDTGWTLPNLNVRQSSELEVVRDTLRDSHNVVAAILECFVEDSAEFQNSVYFAALNADNVNSAQTCWIPLTAADEIPLAPAQATSWLRRWIEIKSDPRYARTPWKAEGWFTEVSRWVKSSVEALGGVITDRVRQIRISDVSCVLKCETSLGNPGASGDEDRPCSRTSAVGDFGDRIAYVNGIR